MSYYNVTDHYSMAYDTLRNEAYANALKELIHPGCKVLDLGAGIGIHGLLAAVNGAQKVYMVDKSPVIEAASRIVRKNNLQKKITCQRGRIEEVDIKERVDIIISVFTGNFLLDEDLLQSLFAARDKLLKPGGHLIPDRAVMKIVPVSAAQLYHQKINCWLKKNMGLDFSDIRPYAANNIFYINKETEIEFLASPEPLMELDFIIADRAECRRTVHTTITKSGTCHGCLGWFDMRLGSQWLSTSPTKEQTHWSQAFLPFDPPLTVQKDEKLELYIHRPENGDWTWSVKHKDQVQKHSTFLQTPRPPKDFLIRSPQYTPSESKKSKAAQVLLSLVNGQSTVASLNNELIKQFPDLFQTKEEAKRFVQALVFWIAD